METNEIKIKQEELDKIKQLSIKYNDLIYNLGKLNLEKNFLKKREMALDSAIDEIIDSYEEFKKEEEILINSINNEYGAGNLNIETGIFTPIKQEKNK